MDKSKSIITYAILFLFLNTLFAQEEFNHMENANEDEISQDTICFNYKFFPKDTLIYKLEALDSISTLDDQPFFRQRTEYIRVIVDSIDKNNNFYLIYETIEYHSKEWNEKSDTIFRDNALHIGRQNLIVIDSLGNRLMTKSLSSKTALTNPGGLFQPVLFFPLVESCKKQMQTWLTRTTDTLIENAFPPAIINNTSLMKISKIDKRENDTIVLITFVRTGKGLYALANKELDMELTSVTNSYGELSISIVNSLPIRFFMTQELKVKLKVNEDAEKPTWQNTIITYELVKQSHNDNIIKDEIIKMRKELKKTK